jgi:MoaA/NifB/PqqE/SkfB family radical SAM enzyme
MQFSDTAALANIKVCDLGIALECNFQCRMCYFWKPSDKMKEGISNDDWKHCFAQLHRFCSGDMTLIFSGPGEPLMRKGIDNLLAQAHRYFRVFLLSNGFLIDDAMAGVIARTVDTLFLSLDGVQEQTHDRIRGKAGAFQSVLHALKQVRARAPAMKIIINTVMLRDNFNELPALVRFVDTQALDGIVFQAVVSPFDARVAGEWYKKDFSFLWPEDTAATERIIDALITLKQGGSAIVNPLPQLHTIKTYFRNPECSIAGLRCEVDTVLKIDYRGNLRMCSFAEPLGNIVRDDLATLWYSPEAQRQRMQAHQCRQPCHMLINCFNS